MLTFSPEFDLAVIGGGPAGSAAAITAARLGARVVLLERRVSFPGIRFVANSCRRMRSGCLPDCCARRRRPNRCSTTRCPLITLVFSRGNRVLEAAVTPPALSITRYDLDAALWQATQVAGVQTRANCEVPAAHGDGPFGLQTADGELCAKALVVAAGRWSQFTADRTIPAGPKWIGLKAHFHEARPSRSTDLYFFPHGYCGVQPVAAEGVNVCAMVRSDRATSLQEVFALHPQLASRAAGWKAVTQPVSTAPLIIRQPQATRGNMMFVGDAAAFIDPFAGDGISIALRSGEAAGQSVGAGLWQEV